MLSWAVKLNIRQALDVLGTQQSNSKTQQIYVTVTKTAVGQMEMSLVHTIGFSGLQQVECHVGCLTCTNWVMWRRNKLSNSFHATDYPKSWGRRRARESRQWQKEGWLVMMVLREIQPRESVSRKPGSLNRARTNQCAAGFGSRRQQHWPHLPVPHPPQQGRG